LDTVIPPFDSSTLNKAPLYIHSDEQGTAGNTNDLRGKILRIIPNDNGSYSIPEGNLFPPGMANARPEIYIMGVRNPWRLSVDTKTGYLYWGDPGRDEEQRHVVGLRGFDEFNQAKTAGNFGWPIFIADNKLYKNDTDSSLKSDQVIKPDKPFNNSPNNTGLIELPPAQKAMIWYPYGLSDSFPLVGSSGRSAVGGPVYRRADFPNPKRPFPSYYEGKWFITDFMRGWIMAVTMNENGDYQSMEPFLPKENFGSAIDMDFSPDGDLYILEYGTAWFQANTNARLVKIEYNAGNRKPYVEINADKVKGAVPMKVKLSSSGTFDYDKDSLKYEWKIAGKGSSRFFRQANPR
jgi:cytochrome c